MSTADAIHTEMSESRDCDVDKDVIAWHTADLNKSKAL